MVVKNDKKELQSDNPQSIKHWNQIFKDLIFMNQLKTLSVTERLTRDFQQLDKEFDMLPSQGNNQSIYDFKYAIKAYTDPRIYQKLNASLRASSFDRIQQFMMTALDGLKTFGNEMKTPVDPETGVGLLPVYRAVSAPNGLFISYKPSSIFNWKTFAICSTNKEFAVNQMRLKSDKSYLGSLFKIHLCPENRPRSSIQLG